MRNDLRGSSVCSLSCELGRGADKEGIRSNGLKLEVAVDFGCHCFCCLAIVVDGYEIFLWSMMLVNATC